MTRPMSDPGRRIRELEYEVEQLRRQLVQMDAALCGQSPETLRLRRYEDALLAIVRDARAETVLQLRAMEALGSAVKRPASFPPGAKRCDARSGGRRCLLLVGHRDPETLGRWPVHNDGEATWVAAGYGIQPAADNRRAEHRRPCCGAPRGTAMPCCGDPASVQGGAP